MSTIGSPIETSLLQTAQAQRTAATKRNRERAQSEKGQRRADHADLKVAGTEAADAVRALPQNDSEEAHSEHQGQPDLHDRPDEDKPRIDVVA
ncbi:MAG: hypothetical protein AAF432_06080 [Planctomycetota bacterium]